MNREEWLIGLTDYLKPNFTAAGFPIPPIRVSVGWPSTRALSAKKRRIGECWAAKAAGDGIPQIFISPILEDPISVGETLVHELGHACVGHEAKHGAPFKAFMRSIGLTGKATATYAGELLKADLTALAVRLGTYPHATLLKLAGPEKKQNTRMIKVTCPSCAYTVRTTKKWIEVGLPSCPAGDEMVAESEKEEGE